MATAALCLCAGDLLAQTKSAAVVPAMSTRPDAAQLQAAIWEWIVVTATSTNFLIGLGAGVVLAEGARIVLRWLIGTVALLNGTFQLAVRYRLALAAVVGGIGYAATQWHAFG